MAIIDKNKQFLDLEGLQYTWKKAEEHFVRSTDPVFTGSISMGRSNTLRSGSNSVAFGLGLVANHDYTHVTGKYNVQVITADRYDPDNLYAVGDYASVNVAVEDGSETYVWVYKCISASYREVEAEPVDYSAFVIVMSRLNIGYIQSNHYYSVGDLVCDSVAELPPGQRDPRVSDVSVTVYRCVSAHRAESGEYPSSSNKWARVESFSGDDIPSEYLAPGETPAEPADPVDPGVPVEEAEEPAEMTADQAIALLNVEEIQDGKYYAVGDLVYFGVIEETDSTPLASNINFSIYRCTVAHTAGRNEDPTSDSNWAFVTSFDGDEIPPEYVNEAEAEIPASGNGQTEVAVEEEPGSGSGAEEVVAEAAYSNGTSGDAQEEVVPEEVEATFPWDDEVIEVPPIEPGGATPYSGAAEEEAEALPVYDDEYTPTGNTFTHENSYGTFTWEEIACYPLSSYVELAEVVGNGTPTKRSNARTLDWDGNERLAGKLTVGKSPTGAWDVTTKKYVDNLISELRDDMNYVKIEVNSLSVSPAVVEVGSTTSSVVLTYSLNKTASSIKVNNAIPSSYNQTKATITGSWKNTTPNTTTAFTIEATDERDYTAVKSVEMKHQNNIYYGAAAAPSAINEAFVEGLATKIFDGNTRKRTITVTSGANQYIYYALPKRLGTCTFSVGGFTGGFTLAKTISVKNASNYTEDYYVYKSDNANLGGTTIAIT